MNWSVLELIKQCETLHELDAAINWDEFMGAVNSLKNEKAPGLNGVPPEAFKAMDDECKRYIFGYINKYWDNKKDCEGWHNSQCVLVPKSGDISNPNKWRGVMLMDVMSKILIRVMHERAFKILDKHGTKFQFGGTPKLGCQDDLFTLKSILNTRKNHDLPSFVAFFYLVKA